MNKLIEVDSVTATENESSKKDKEIKFKAAILSKYGFDRCDPTVIKTLMGGAQPGDFHRYRTNCFQSQDDRVKSHAARIRRARSVSYNPEDEQLDVK